MVRSKYSTNVDYCYDDDDDNDNDCARYTWASVLTVVMSWVGETFPHKHKGYDKAVWLLGTKRMEKTIEF